MTRDPGLPLALALVALVLLAVLVSWRGGLRLERDLLGGGTALQAGAAQVLVLVGLLAAETVTVTVAHRLMRRRALLPPDLRSELPR